MEEKMTLLIELYLIASTLLVCIHIGLIRKRVKLDQGAIVLLYCTFPFPLINIMVYLVSLVYLIVSVRKGEVKNESARM